MSAITPAALFAATDHPKNLGNGLDKVVEREVGALAGKATSRVGARSGVDLGDRAIRDGKGRILVTVYLRNPAARKDVAAIKDVVIKAEDMKYQGGAMDVFVPAARVKELANARGVSSVIMAIHPIADVGATTSQGVHQHRVDQITNQRANPVTGVTGKGISVGVLSDSYNTAPGRPKAGDDVRSGDLPHRVTVLEDFRGGNDEGRAMCQIIHDMAPDARLGFATAEGGEVNFANNIRRLAAPKSEGGFGANVIVDDIIYFTEGMFQDTIVARAVDEVAADGVSYFSSAGNRPSTQGYFADFNPVPGNRRSADGTNLKLRDVPRELYAGGFHNFNPSGPVDIAQTVLVGGFVGGTDPAIFDFQWDDPYDVAPVTTGAKITSGTGTVPPKGSFDFTFQGSANERVQIQVSANRSTPDFDSIITLFDPDGQAIVQQDTGADETLLIFLPKTGTYTVRVTQFGEQTGGVVDYRVDQASGEQEVTTDFNILFFDRDGSFIGASGEDNRQTNRPIELAQVFPFQTTDNLIQVVIARSNVPPPSPQPATRIRYVTFTTGEPLEYFSFQTPITFGHNSAAGGNGVAAYAFYPPFLPEYFTSPGPAIIAFDQQNNRLPQPDIRQKPDMAAMDGANTTFFVSDASQDKDTFPNFFGTSAAAPHAAAIAALVLERRGGPDSIDPSGMRGILQRSAFLHDLDPNSATATVDNPNVHLTIRLDSDGGSFISTLNPDAFKVEYQGTGSLRQLIFNPQATDETAGNTTEPLDTTPGFTSRPGLVFDNRPPTVGFPFTLGSTEHVSRRSDISSAYRHQAPPPALVGTHFYTLVVNLAPDALTNGGFTFGQDRDEADAFGPSNTVGGNFGDLLGQGVLIPEGTVAPGGMTLSGLTDSGRFNSRFTNQLGHGYSPVDGYGFINAEAAVKDSTPATR